MNEELEKEEDEEVKIEDEECYVNEKQILYTL